MAKSDQAAAENPILETVKTIVYALLLAGLFRTLFSALLDPIWINEGHAFNW